MSERLGYSSKDDIQIASEAYGKMPNITYYLKKCIFKPQRDIT